MTTYDAPLPVAAPAATESRRKALWRALTGSLDGRLGLGLATLVIITIIVGPYVAPYDPNEIGLDLGNAGPSSEHLLGVDSLGRDILSRFLSGGRSVILVPVMAVTVAFLIGGTLGMLGAYRGGKVDRVVARLFDLMLALPGLLIVLVLIAGLGKSTLVLVLSVALVFIAGTGRVVRGAAQAVVTNDYVAAAQARGERTPSILAHEVLPNIVGPVIADFALRMTWAVLFVAGLNFLGLGQQPPSSDWGVMVAQGRAYLDSAPLGTLVPAFGIAFLAVSFNLIADALTRHLSPETRKGDRI